MTKSVFLNRRDALKLTAGGAAALLGPAALASSLQLGAGPAAGSLPFGDPIWNREAFARLQATLNTKEQKVGWYSGKVMGVRDGEPLRELMGFEGFSVARMLPQAEDGSYRKLLREVGFYRDLRTGKLIDEYDNPYTGERVRVVPILNDPFNFTVSEFVPQPPDYGGLNPVEMPKIPLLLPWTEKVGKVLLSTDIHLFYPSALQPDEWPRESPGPMTRVSELFRYIIDRDALADHSRDSIPYRGTWSRVTPWLPWMLMDGAPGHCLYMCDMGTTGGFDIVADDVLERAEALDPKWLEAPTEDYGPSLSSLETYRLTETPAPPRDSAGN
jgi:hypothetical protein